MAGLASASRLRLPLAFGYTIESMSDDRSDKRPGVEEGDSIARSAFRRGAKLATLPLGFAGRATLGLGKRIGGAPAEQVTQ